LHRAIYDTVREIDGPPNARQLFIEASSLLATQGWHHDSFVTAADLLRRSCALQPHFALAPAYLSLVLGLGERIGMIADREATRAEALDAAELALRLDSMDDTVLGFAGCALADIGYPARARPILQNAVEVNPANAQAWAALGSACLLLGQVHEAIDHLQHSIAISPLDSRLSIWGALLTLALLLVDDLEAALRQGTLAIQRDDRNYMPRVVLAAVYLARGDTASAQQSMCEAHRIKADLSQSLVASFVGTKLAAALTALGGHPSTDAD
jgi:tetratricopeptide (TPR) repeat protein